MVREEPMDDFEELIESRDAEHAPDIDGKNTDDIAPDGGAPQSESIGMGERTDTVDARALPSADTGTRVESSEPEPSTDVGAESREENRPTLAAAEVPAPPADEQELLAMATESLARAEAIAAEYTRDLVHRHGDSSPGAFAPLPRLRGQPQSAIEFLGDGVRDAYATAGGTQGVEVPLSPLGPSRGASPSADVQRLVIEVEVTLANAETVSTIATRESQAEYKRLASESVSKVRHDLRQFRESYRAVWGRD